MAPKRESNRQHLSRRSLLTGGAVAIGGLTLGSSVRYPVWAQGVAPAVITRDASRPGIPYGVQSGDVSKDRVVVWSRTDRPARMIVEYSTTDSFKDVRRVIGPAALPEGDFTARVDLADLPAGQAIFYKVIFQDLADPKVLSTAAAGRFNTPPAGRRTCTFAWSGDE